MERFNKHLVIRSIILSLVLTLGACGGGSSDDTVAPPLVDSDADGVADNVDAFPNDPNESADSDMDGVGDNGDAFPDDPNETADTDMDAVGNNSDAFPDDPNESLDTDMDGTGNNADLDDDNDNVEDAQDAFPLDPFESVDSDSDGVGNNADNDDDNDGVEDALDMFPLDPNESADNDLDGIGNNADTDDDNDGTSDVNDDFPLNAARTKPIEALFPTVNGQIQLPNTPAANQLEWIIAQLAATSTSEQDILDRFDPAPLAQFSVAQWQGFFDTLRAVIANGTVQDTYSITPTSISILIGNADDPSNGQFMTLTTTYSSGKILSFGASAFPLNGGSTAGEDLNLSYETAADKLETLAEDVGVLVARIDENNQCMPIFSRNPTDPLGTASIFKIWTLGAIANSIEDGTLTREQTIPLVSENVVLGGTISQEIGTQFRIDDLASLMLGISDNTATEHLFKLAGRPAHEAVLDQFNHANQDAMEPFLSMNEAFHLYFTVPLNEAIDYVNADEATQRTYVDNVLTPLGPVTNFSRANGAVLVNGLWQASPMDVCSAMAELRQYNDTTEAFDVIDQAYGATTAIINLRNKWERVWFKGGSLDDGFGLRVLTYGWMVESDNRGAYAVIVMTNNDSGGNARIEQNPITSVSSRILDIVDDTN
jgi:beta-lactamase class A